MNQELFFREGDFIVSKTDTHGKIVYGNEIFIQMSGYAEKELIGKPHNILRHPDMPAFIFKYLWQQIKAGEEVFAYVINRTKEGDYYWVFAHVTPSFGMNGEIVGYHSVRRVPKPSALGWIKPLYARMVAAEKSGGMAASEKIVMETLKGENYDEFILSL